MESENAYLELFFEKSDVFINIQLFIEFNTISFSSYIFGESTFFIKVTRIYDKSDTFCATHFSNTLLE